MPLTENEAAQLFREEPERFLDVGAGEVAHRKIGSAPTYFSSTVGQSAAPHGASDSPTSSIT